MENLNDIKPMTYAQLARFVEMHKKLTFNGLTPIEDCVDCENVVAEVLGLKSVSEMDSLVQEVKERRFKNAT